MKKIIPAIIALILLGVGAYFFYINTKKDKKPEGIIEISGSIETTETELSFQIPGRILKLTAEEGDRVKKGELIATLDAKEIDQSIAVAKSSAATIESQLPQLNTKIESSEVSRQKQLDVAQAQINEASLRWESIKKGSRSEEIARAASALSQAKTNLSHNKKEYERGVALYKEGAMPGQQKDQLFTAYRASQDSVRQAEETLKLLQKGPRTEDIQAAGSKIAQAKANYELIRSQSLQTKQLEDQKIILNSQLKQAQESVKQLEIQKRNSYLYSPVNGTVITKNRETGETVNPGTSVVTVADLSNIYMKAFVNEAYLGKIRIGQEIDVTTDSFPGKIYKGKIYYIANEAEFTPKNLTTKEDRVKLVYRIKVKLDNPDYELKPGMIADGEIKANDYSQ